MKSRLTACLLCLFVGAAGGAESESDSATSSDQRFVNHAIQDGLTEVELGKIAQTRSSDPAVKAFAAQMVKDHGKTNAELGALAAQKKLKVPTQLDGDHATILHRFSAKPASEFDTEYGKQMIEAHEMAVTLFSDAAAVGDKDLAAFAKKTLPTLREHQRMAAMLPAKGPAPTEPPPQVGSDTPLDSRPAPR